MPTKPSLRLLKSMTDEHILDALLSEPALTRAELADRTGLSKPTVSDGVRRLEAAGLVRDTGERTSGRGGVGSYYALADGLGAALVVSIGPDGIIAESLDLLGAVLAREMAPVAVNARPVEVVRALQQMARAVVGAASLAVVSAADPVDRDTGRLVQLPDSPFLVGELDPVQVLREFVGGPIEVDNDVNWAARAEPGSADFAYLYLGEGLGCAVVSDGAVRRGHRGLAGEVSHLTVRGPRGQATTFIDIFGLLHLRKPDSTAIDVDALVAAMASDGSLRSAIGYVVCDVLAALVALADPELIVIGGRWGMQPEFVAELTEQFSQRSRSVPLRPASNAIEAPLAGARQRAVAALREQLFARVRG